jgi:ABC-type Fe3+ transport system permease subunit
MGNSAAIAVLSVILVASSIVYLLSQRSARRAGDPMRQGAERPGMPRHRRYAEPMFLAAYVLVVFGAGVFLAPGPIAAVLVVAVFSTVFIVGVSLLSGRSG